MDSEEYKKMSSAMDAAQIAWWEMELPSGKMSFAPTKATMLGYDPNEERFKTYHGFTDLVDPADYKPMMQDMQRHLTGEVPVYETMYRIKAADGSYKQFYDRGTVVERDGDKITLRGFVTNVNNITQYAYNVTAKLRERAEKYEKTGQIDPEEI